MKILHLYKDYAPVMGGIENHMRVLAEAQAQRGHDVTVLVANRGWRTSHQTMNGVHVVRASRLGTIASTPISPSLFGWLSRLDTDITHLHFPHPPGEVAQLLVGRAKATVLTYHSDIVRQRRLLRIYEPLLRRVLARASRILVTSPAYAETSRYLLAVRDKCTVIPLGIDVDHFQDQAGEPTARLRARWGLPADRPVVVFVGRIRCYKAGDLFVLPSHTRAEAFGTSIVEAMSAGLPVISTEIRTGTSWVNQAGVTGLV